MPRGGYSSSGDDEALGVLLILALIGLVIWGIVKLVQLVVSFIAANAGTILTVGFTAMLAVGILGLAVDRLNRARAYRVSRPSVEVESASNDSARRLVLLRYFLDFAPRALQLCRADELVPRWTGEHRDMLSSVILLKRSATERAPRGLPDPAALPHPTYNEVLRALDGLEQLLRTYYKTTKANAATRADALRLLERSRTEFKLLLDDIDKAAR